MYIRKKKCSHYLTCRLNKRLIEEMYSILRLQLIDDLSVTTKDRGTSGLRICTSQ